MAASDASRGGPAAPDRRPYYEIQYHPSDIRKSVRYVFLTRRQVGYAVAGVVLWIALVANGIYVAPRVISNLLAAQEYDTLAAERSRQGERLKEMVRQLSELEQGSDELRIEMSKIYLAYGLSEEDSRGKGGYPLEPGKVPNSIYADAIRRGNGLMARINEQIGVLGVFLTEVQSFEEAHRDQVRTTPSISPLRGEEFVLTSPFGSRTSPFTRAPDFHAGIDLAAAVGTPVYASADGVVAFAGRYPLKQSVGWWRYGNLVAVRNGDRFITLYGHCQEIKVTNGQRVEQGDVIATVGNTGWSTSPHLHYEVRRLEDGGEYTPIDPRIYILDHRWRDEERILVSARTSPDAQEYEPLPPVLER